MLSMFLLYTLKNDISINNKLSSKSHYYKKSSKNTKANIDKTHSKHSNIKNFSIVTGIIGFTIILQKFYSKNKNHIIAKVEPSKIQPKTLPIQKSFGESPTKISNASFEIICNLKPLKNKTHGSYSSSSNISSSQSTIKSEQSPIAMTVVENIPLPSHTATPITPEKIINPENSNTHSNPNELLILQNELNNLLFFIDKTYTINDFLNIIEQLKLEILCLEGKYKIIEKILIKNKNYLIKLQKESEDCTLNIKNEKVISSNLNKQISQLEEKFLENSNSIQYHKTKYDNFIIESLKNQTIVKDLEIEREQVNKKIKEIDSKINHKSLTSPNEIDYMNSQLNIFKNQRNDLDNLIVQCNNTLEQLIQKSLTTKKEKDKKSIQSQEETISDQKIKYQYDMINLNNKIEQLENKINLIHLNKKLHDINKKIKEHKDLIDRNLKLSDEQNNKILELQNEQALWENNKELLWKNLQESQKKIETLSEQLKNIKLLEDCYSQFINRRNIKIELYKQRLQNELPEKLNNLKARVNKITAIQEKIDKNTKTLS